MRRTEHLSDNKIGGKKKYNDCNLNKKELPTHFFFASRYFFLFLSMIFKKILSADNLTKLISLIKHETEPKLTCANYDKKYINKNE